MAIHNIQDSDALLLYKVGPVLVCSPTMPVESVIMPPKLTMPPGTNRAEPGVFKSLHGIVRLVDLRVRFGVDEEDFVSPGRIVIVEVEGGHAGFWVDDIEDVISFPKDGWRQVPSYIPRQVFSRTLIQGKNIRLYADFEQLDKFKTSGYLRKHIEMIKAAESKHDKPEVDVAVDKKIKDKIKENVTEVAEKSLTEIEVKKRQDVSADSIMEKKAHNNVKENIVETKNIYNKEPFKEPRISSLSGFDSNQKKPDVILSEQQFSDKKSKTHLKAVAVNLEDKQPSPVDSVVKKNLKTSNANAGNDNSVFVLIGVALILFVAIYFLVDSFDFSHKMILEQTVDGGQELNKEVITEVEIEKSVLQLSDTEQDDIFDEKSVDFEEPRIILAKLKYQEKTMVFL